MAISLRSPAILGVRSGFSFFNLANWALSDYLP